LEALPSKALVEPVAPEARQSKVDQASPKTAAPVLVEPIGIEPMTY
jgi:hypothetical protein